MGPAPARVLFAARSAAALHRLLDLLPVFEGDDRVRCRFTLVPGSEFDTDALAAVDAAGARCLPWSEARAAEHDLILTASPKGGLGDLRGHQVLLPHGAGFNKALPDEGSPVLPSGLDPAFLLSDGRPTATLHALAHPSQVERLAAQLPSARGHAIVAGDPTLDRILESLDRRDAIRAALGTGARRLVVLSSTWGPESLLARRPGLPASLAARLPHDAYQLALIVHPNEYSRTGAFDLVRQLRPALDAGLVLAAPYEEWAALLVACDVVVSDHGSVALYAAALDRPVVAGCVGASELIPGSPMAELLSSVPHLDLDTAAVALASAEPARTRRFAEQAFALTGESLETLRAELYKLLGLSPSPYPVRSRPLPVPGPARTAPHAPAAFAVRAVTEGRRVTVERLPPWTDLPLHHRAAEYGRAGVRQLQSAALIYQRCGNGSSDQPRTNEPSPNQHHTNRHHTNWHQEYRTAADRTAEVLDEYPGCRTAAVVLSPAACLVRRDGAEPFTLRIGPARAGTRIRLTDPAAALSAVHAWLGAHPLALPGTLTARIGGTDYRVDLTPATEAELAHPA
ncbi:translation initiation factor 2 [Kitasatospora sp. NPDC057904]|uniref:translation initiation factor 2 n=1 Tax=Kitasatospora sp. NPDC057904 TaxID=3346275 RepID=UPI0036DEEA23